MSKVHVARADELPIALDSDGERGETSDDWSPADGQGEGRDFSVSGPNTKKKRKQAAKAPTRALQASAKKAPTPTPPASMSARPEPSAAATVFPVSETTTATSTTTTTTRTGSVKSSAAAAKPATTTSLASAGPSPPSKNAPANRRVAINWMLASSDEDESEVLVQETPKAKKKKTKLQAKAAVTTTNSNPSPVYPSAMPEIVFVRSKTAPLASASATGSPPAPTTTTPSTPPPAATTTTATTTTAAMTTNDLPAPTPAAGADVSSLPLKEQKRLQREQHRMELQAAKEARKLELRAAKEARKQELLARAAGSSPAAAPTGPARTDEDDTDELMRRLMALRDADPAPASRTPIVFPGAEQIAAVAAASSKPAAASPKSNKAAASAAATPSPPKPATAAAAVRDVAPGVYHSHKRTIEFDVSLINGVREMGFELKDVLLSLYTLSMEDRSLSTESVVDHLTSSTQFMEAICCVCLERPKSSVLMPCGHVCLCNICGDGIKGKNCPICRVKVVNTHKVFLC